MFVQNLDQLQEHGIHAGTFRVITGILYRYRVGQLIVSQKIPVAVIDVATGTRCRHGFFDHLDIIFQIGFSVYDLKVEQLGRQNQEHAGKYQRQRKNTGA